MTYKEFYIWLDGFMTNRDWVVIKQVDIETIQEKMKEVNVTDQPVIETKTIRSNPFIPIPVNPIPRNNEPHSVPFEVYCGNKEQLND